MVKSDLLGNFHVNKPQRFSCRGLKDTIEMVLLKTNGNDVIYIYYN